MPNRSQARDMGMRPVFYRSRKPGKFSPKSKMIYPQVGPTFTHKTSQQRKIADAGKICGGIIKGKYTGSGNVEERRKAMADCIREQFGKEPIYGGSGWYK